MGFFVITEFLDELVLTLVYFDECWQWDVEDAYSAGSISSTDSLPDWVSADAESSGSESN